MDRRNFIKKLAAGSALSVMALNDLNAEIYEKIDLMNKAYPGNQSPDGKYWDMLRKKYMFTDDVIMMNNGTVGPMPEPVYNTLLKYFKIQANNPYDTYNFVPSLKENVRTKLAKFINASPEEVAIVRNTTEGMSAFANGLEMKKGDEVIISSHEHPSGINPWKLKEARYGIKIKEVPLGVPSKSVEEIISAFENAITGKTKVICISHTVFITGLIFPLKELSEMAHKKDILVLADSAHGVGMLNLDMKELGIDAFCSSPYKWGGAPCGNGVFYIKKEVQERIWPVTVQSQWDRYEDARRYENLGQKADPLVLAFGEALDFQNRIGKSRVERRIKAMSNHLKDGLKTISRVKIHLPEDPYLCGGLTAFSMEGIEAGRIVDHMREKCNIVIRTIGNEKKGTRGVRVSTNIFVSKKHVDMLLNCVNDLAKV